MCKTLLQIQCTIFNPKKIKMKFEIFCTKCLFGITFIVDIAELKDQLLFLSVNWLWC